MEEMYGTVLREAQQSVSHCVQSHAASTVQQSREKQGSRKRPSSEPVTFFFHPLISSAVKRTTCLLS